MNQGKLEVVKEEMARANIDILGISELTWTGIQFSSVAQVCPAFCDPWAAACQISLSITNSRSLLKLMSIVLVMPSIHLILCHPLFPPSIFTSISVFSNHIRWPKYWSFSFNISSSKEPQDWSPLGWTGWISLQSKGLSSVFSNTKLQKHQFFSTQLSSQSNSRIRTWLLEKS